MTLSRIARTALAFCLMLTMVNAPPLGAQSGTSSALAGSVADKSGAVVPDAQVKATEVNTGAVRAVQSNFNKFTTLSMKETPRRWLYRRRKTKKPCDFRPRQRRPAHRPPWLGRPCRAHNCE